MEVIGGEPFWYQRDAMSDWVEIDQASRYENYNLDRDKQKGDFVENLITYSHILFFGTHFIHLHVGLSGNVGVDYNFDLYADVRTALKMPKHRDFIGVLDNLGHAEDSVVTETAIAKLQSFVDNARESD